VSRLGPFSDERAAARAARSWPSGGEASGNPNLALLLDVLLAAGVELGAWDQRIVAWLAGFEPSTCAVIAGMIIRAHEAGKAGRP
jgi:hypothetical protein